MNCRRKGISLRQPAEPKTGWPGEESGKSRRRDVLFLALLAGILIAGLIFRLHNVGTVQRQGFDAFHYSRQAQIALEQGSAGLRAEAARFQSDKSMWGVPPPWRAGFLYAAAGWMALTNTTGPETMAYFAAWIDALALVLLGFLSWRLFGPMPAAIAMSLYAFSPPILQMARHGWEEPFLSLLGIASLIFATRAIEEEAWWWPALLGATAGFAISVKELAFVDAGLVTGFAAVALLRARAWGQLRRLCGAFLAALAAFGGWMVWIVGGPAQLLRYSVANFHAAADIPYSVRYESGSVMTWLQMIWRSDPLLLLLGIAGIAILAVEWRKRPPVMVWAAGVAILLFTLPPNGSHLLNLRFTSAAIAPLCLMAALVFTRILSRQNLLLSASAALAFMAVAIPLNVHLYRTVFEAPGLEDLSAGMIVGLPQREPPAPRSSNEFASADLVKSSLEYINAHELTKAKEVLARLLAAEPNSVAGWNNLCVAHTMDHEFDQALAACGRALSIDPGYQLARNNLNWAKDEMRAGR